MKVEQEVTHHSHRIIDHIVITVDTRAHVFRYLYQVCKGGFCAKLSWFWPRGHGVAPHGPYLRLWWTYALDPAHRRDPDTPQQEKIDADRTLFLGLDLICMILKG